MYKIDGQQYALESGDKITIIRDGGGTFKVTLKSEEGVDTIIIEATDD